MRYSSSKAAVSSGSSSSSSSGGGRSSSNYSSPSYGGSSYSSPPPARSTPTYSSPPSSSSSGLHYKKDGSLDMRYSSSKQAAAASSPPPRAASSSTSSNPNLHYKKDGSLDMRYSSSKQAAATTNSPSNADLHYKKDGSLDMRYSSSKQAAATTNSPSNAGLHYKKDGSLDMRYKSSWTALNDPKANNSATKKKGSELKSKTKMAGQTEEEVQRFDYLFDRLENCPEFFDEYARLRENPVDMGVPMAVAVEVDDVGQSYVISMEMGDDIDIDDVVGQLGDKFDQLVMVDTGDLVREFKFNELDVSSELLGKGGFGQVFLGSVAAAETTTTRASSGILRNIIDSFKPAVASQLLAGKRPVAVKKMFLDELNKSEKREFLHEIKVMSLIGIHPNVIGLVGYCLDTPAIIMEYASKKSLSYQLYHNQDPTDEAKMACGSIKKKIIFGIANGLNQIHSRNIVHGDIKSPNILLDDDFTPKICDFGLSKLKAKTASTVGSTIFDADGKVGGTYAYMAPELSDFSIMANFKTDVYAYGVLMNEIISELEPYQAEYQLFHGRGPTAPWLYAQQGNRPRISPQTSPGFVRMINQCWSPTVASRPLLSEILNALYTDQSLIIQDTFSENDVVSVALSKSRNF